MCVHVWMRGVVYVRKCSCEWVSVRVDEGAYMHGLRGYYVYFFGVYGVGRVRRKDVDVRGLDR